MNLTAETQRTQREKMDVNKLSSNIIGAAIEVHKAQLLTYLILSGIYLGLILNFNVPVMRDSL